MQKFLKGIILILILTGCSQNPPSPDQSDIPNTPPNPQIQPTTSPETSTTPLN